MRAITNSLIAVILFLLAGSAWGQEVTLHFTQMDAVSGDNAWVMWKKDQMVHELPFKEYREQSALLGGFEDTDEAFRHRQPGSWKVPVAPKYAGQPGITTVTLMVGSDATTQVVAEEPADLPTTEMPLVETSTDTLTPTVEAVVETAPAEIKQTNIRVAVLESVVVGHKLALPTYYAFAPVRSSEQIGDDELKARHEAAAQQTELESLREKVDSLAEANDRLATEKIKALADAERLKQEQASRSQLLPAPIVIEGRVSNDSSPNWWAIGIPWIILASALLWIGYLYRKTKRQSRVNGRLVAEKDGLSRELERQTASAKMWESRWKTEKARADLRFYTFRLKGMEPEEIRFPVDQITVREVPGCRGSIPVEELEDFLRNLEPDQRRKMGIMRFPEENEASPEVVRFFLSQTPEPETLALRSLITK